MHNSVASNAINFGYMKNHSVTYGIHVNKKHCHYSLDNPIITSYSTFTNCKSWTLSLQKWSKISHMQLRSWNSGKENQYPTSRSYVQALLSTKCLDKSSQNLGGGKTHEEDISMSPSQRFANATKSLALNTTPRCQHSCSHEDIYSQAIVLCI